MLAESVSQRARENDRHREDRSDGEDACNP
jgi:hypothetical protein